MSSLDELLANARRRSPDPTSTSSWCNEGYASSLAAATLQDDGLRRVTDIAGGFVAWRVAGLPVEPFRG